MNTKTHSTSRRLFRGGGSLAAAVALVVLAAPSLAAGGQAWTPTLSRAHDPGNAVHRGPMKADALVRIVVSLKLRNKAELDALTDGPAPVSDTGPLDPAQFAARYAPTQAQVHSVVAYLQAKGFADISVADNRLLVSAVGSPKAIEDAFRAELHEYEVDGRRARANTTDVMVPADLADTVLGVLGLQTIHRAHTTLRRAAPGAARSASVVPIDIPAFPAIYGAASMPSATNAVLGIITQGSMAQTLADLKTFAAGAGYPAPSVTVVPAGSSSGDTSGVEEWNMDSQASLAAAGGRIGAMRLYTTGTLYDADLTQDFNQAVSENLARVINVSLGACETSERDSGAEATDDQIFQVAVAQGQTFAVSSGDAGAWECGTAARAQSYPAVSRYVMAIGGTRLQTSNGTAWAGETVWPCSGASSCQLSGGAGGGSSLTEPAPSWQVAAKVLGTATTRGVPDVSFDADPRSGANVLVAGQHLVIGGTSLAAPLFTGFYARIQSAHGNGLPFPARTLYAGATSHPSWFRDVVSGRQDLAAGPGWDYASGFGSLQVANFSSAIVNVLAVVPVIDTVLLAD